MAVSGWANRPDTTITWYQNVLNLPLLEGLEERWRRIQCLLTAEEPALGRLPMELRVDDFGCVPNGRVLERVAIAAGSAVLTSPDGGLRAADVGKNIAIPGGVDLDATIASLANITKVKNASMTA